MSATDFLQLPPAVSIAFVVLLWPAIWAGSSFIVAFAGDIIRQKRKDDASRLAGGATRVTT
jgi:hypothetical protein